MFFNICSFDHKFCRLWFHLKVGYIERLSRSIFYRDSRINSWIRSNNNWLLGDSLGDFQFRFTCLNNNWFKLFSYDCFNSKIKNRLYHDWLIIDYSWVSYLCHKSWFFDLDCCKVQARSGRYNLDILCCECFSCNYWCNLEI